MDNLLTILAIDVYGLASLLALGVILILVEIFVVPGTTFVGILGVGALLLSIWAAYSYHEPMVGHIVLASAVLAFIIFTFLAFRANTWKYFTLASSIEGKVNTLVADKLKVGDQGKAISRLSPMGKALFGEEYYEVRSVGDYIDENKEIEIHKIVGNKIFVKPI